MGQEESVISRENGTSYEGAGESHLAAGTNDKAWTQAASKYSQQDMGGSSVLRKEASRTAASYRTDVYKSGNASSPTFGLVEPDFYGIDAPDHSDANSETLAGDEPTLLRTVAEDLQGVSNGGVAGDIIAHTSGAIASHLSEGEEAMTNGSERGKEPQKSAFEDGSASGPDTHNDSEDDDSEESGKNGEDEYEGNASSEEDERSNTIANNLNRFVAPATLAVRGTPANAISTRKTRRKKGVRYVVADGYEPPVSVSKARKERATFGPEKKNPHPMTSFAHSNPYNPSRSEPSTGAYLGFSNRTNFRQFALSPVFIKYLAEFEVLGGINNTDIKEISC